MESISWLESALCLHSTEAIGLDLAKEDVAIAAFGPDHEEPYLIDRMPYEKLYELLADMAPTLVAMEPCSGAHQIAEQIQELGHEVMMISGRHVQAWVKDHCNGQKTDLNDAFTILNLAFDRWLTPIRGKTVKFADNPTLDHINAGFHAIFVFGMMNAAGLCIHAIVFT